ncbi:MAG TPA: hypothetical protein DCM14_08910 [Clostridiales bacterium UBA8153]|nr:hypothetical protein [Clostridiales bacterium UBA8153]
MRQDVVLAVTCDADRAPVRTGAGPRTLVTWRNPAMRLFRLGGCNGIAKALRSGAWDCSGALELAGLHR